MNIEIKLTHGLAWLLSMIGFLIFGVIGSCVTDPTQIAIFFIVGTGMLWGFGNLIWAIAILSEGLFSKSIDEKAG